MFVKHDEILQVIGVMLPEHFNVSHAARKGLRIAVSLVFDFHGNFGGTVRRGNEQLREVHIPDV